MQEKWLSGTSKSGNYDRVPKHTHRLVKALIEAYIFSGRDPLREDVFRCLGNRPSILQAREIGERIIQKMKEYVEVFESGMVA